MASAMETLPEAWADLVEGHPVEEVLQTTGNKGVVVGLTILIVIGLVCCTNNGYSRKRAVKARLRTYSKQLKALNKRKS